MKLVIFGLSVSSSWGNGHATLWRGLIRALASRGHRVVFFEKNEPFYALHRDHGSGYGFELVVYEQWEDIRGLAVDHVREADAVIVTSYCKDALAAQSLLVESDFHPRIFYDLDTPVTLSGIEKGSMPFYIGDELLSAYDLVISYTGGSSLDKLRTVLSARNALPLYGWVDPEVHRPVFSDSRFKSLLSYLGTYAQDRQEKLSKFLFDTAGVKRDEKFVVGGALYPESFEWMHNISFLRHITPSEHPSFYCSGRFTLNITRAEMARCGYCPSARIFEAAACGVPIISDRWKGMERFLVPGEEIVTVEQTDEVLGALDMSEEERLRISKRARQRTLEEHTAFHRAMELERMIGVSHHLKEYGLCGE
ncbi:MAG: glycosyltransferase [Chitinispirillaceae bacterium]